AGQTHPQSPRRTADHRERAGAGGDIHRASADGRGRGARRGVKMYDRRKRATSLCTLLAGAAVAAAMAPGPAAAVSRPGSTLAYPIYSAWGEAYKKETGIALNYQPVGSSDGISKLQNKEVIFAASDMPLNLVDLDMDGFVQFPTLTAGVVPVVNID